MDPQQPAADGPAPLPEPQVVAGVEQHGDAVVVEIVGEIDALTAPQLAGALGGALAQRPRAVVADLSKVDFFASAGIAALVDAHRQAGGVQFRVVAAGSVTLRVLELTGLTGELAIFATREDALSG
jgi:anti-sigma B factor antagonist